MTNCSKISWLFSSCERQEQRVAAVNRDLFISYASHSVLFSPKFLFSDNSDIDSPKVRFAIISLAGDLPSYNISKDILSFVSHTRDTPFYWKEFLNCSQTKCLFSLEVRYCKLRGIKMLIKFPYTFLKFRK